MTPREKSRSNSPSDAENRELDALLGKAFEDKTTWAGIYDSLRDSFFSPQLPLLQLTSTPVPAPDRMAAGTNPWAVGTATVVNGGLLAALLLLGFRVTSHPYPTPASHSNVDLSDFNQLARAAAQAMHGGGGGGSSSLVDPSPGRPPKFESVPIVPPQIPVLDNPKLPVDSAIAVPLEIKLPDNQLPIIGVHSATQVTVLSGGPGVAGIGAGRDGGRGPGDGTGDGPGTNRGIGDGIYTPGGDVSAPIPIVNPEAEFSDEARRNKHQGICMISVIIDAQGLPQNPRVVRQLGMGLDEKALDAVRRYRFKPAKKNGKAVAVLITVAVDFRLY